MCLLLNPLRETTKQTQELLLTYNSPYRSEPQPRARSKAQRFNRDRPKEGVFAFTGDHPIRIKGTTSRRSLAEKPKVGELQIDWLRSEDLKEQKHIIAIS